MEAPTIKLSENQWGSTGNYQVGKNCRSDPFKQKHLYPDSCQGQPASRARAGKAGEEPRLAATAGRAGPRPRGSEPGRSAGPTTPRDKGAAGTREARAPRAAMGTRLPEANEFYSPDPRKEPRPDSPRCSGGRSPHPIAALSRAQGTRGPTL